MAKIAVYAGEKPIPYEIVPTLIVLLNSQVAADLPTGRLYLQSETDADKTVTWLKARGFENAIKLSDKESDAYANGVIPAGDLSDPHRQPLDAPSNFVIPAGDPAHIKFPPGDAPAHK